MKSYALILLALLAMAVQRQQPQRHCEFVAFVNKDAISSAAYLAALSDYQEELSRQMHQQGKTDDQIGVEFERTKSVVLNAMIDDLLLEQRAEEMRLEDDAEIKKIIENPALLIHPGYRDDFGPIAFRETLKNQTMDLEQSRNSIRKQILRQAVVIKEVLVPIFNSITDEDRLNYYSAHKEEFILPANVTLSEIFLPFDGYSLNEVEQRASSLLAELQAGADFIKAVRENTPVSRTSYATGGHLGSFDLRELRESVLMAISKLDSGEFTQPIQLDEGYMIVRLDSRTAPTLRSYDNPEVEKVLYRVITLSRSENARRSYIAGLRKNAQIQLCSGR